MRRLIPLCVLLFPTMAFGSGGTVLEPCNDGPDEREYARLVGELDSAIQEADDAQDVDAWKSRWDKILDHPCLALSRAEITTSLPKPSDVWSFRDWWTNGGHTWLTYATVEDELVLPPQAREEPSSALVCADPFDDACGAETRAWRLRADYALRRKSLEEGWAVPREGLDEWRKGVVEACEKEARAAKNNPYWAWQSCISNRRRTRASMPVGETRAPRDGWFIVQGRRGHYRFCDEVRLYHLETGAAYIAQSCSGLVLTDGGGVHFGATDANRRVQVQMGRVEPWALREALWMTVLAPGVETVASTEVFFSIPSGIDRRIDASGFGHMSGLSLSWWGSSAQTRLTWKWQQEGTRTAHGDLTWPNSADAGGNYAVELLRVAEATFEAGCPPAKLPGGFYTSPGKPGVSGLDADPHTLLDVQQGLFDALIDVPLPSGCRQ